MATQYSNKPIVTNGLVYALDFGNQKSYVSGSSSARSLKFDPVTGSILTFGGASIPNLQNGLLKMVAPTATTGSTINTLQQFSDLIPTGDFTIQLVATFPASSIFITQGPADTRLISNGSGMLGWYLNPTPYIGGATYKTYTKSIPSGLKHITYRYSSGSYDMFVNGIPVPTAARNQTTSTNTGTLTINGYGTLGLSLATQDLGNFYIYDRALTANEIYSNYLIQAQRYGLPTISKPYTIDENAFLFLSQSGITDPIITSSIDTFVRGLKSASLWDKMIAIYPFVGTGSVGVNLTGSQSWNLKEPTSAFYRLAFTGSWNGSTSGSTPSGSNTSINTGVLPYEYYPFKSDSNQHISILSYDTPTSSSFLAGTGIDTETAISTLAGDYGTPAAAYSVRKVRTAYSGALMDVRRSIDNVTSSIGYVSNGDLDTGSLSTFVNAVGEFSPGNYSGLAAAYSLRKVSASYSGNAIDVRRSSDNTTGSIGFDANGNLDTGSLTTFVLQQKNILLDSEDFSTAAWQKANALITTASITAPDSTLTGNKWEKTNVGGYTELNSAAIGFSNYFGNTSISVYAKSGSINTFRSYGTSGAGGETIYDLSTGTIISGTGSIESAGNGWYRCSAPANNRSIDLYFTGSVGDYIYIWGAQQTTGSTALLPYVKNTSTFNLTPFHGYVTRWYDQSGNNRHATQSVSTQQPLIVSSGSLITLKGKPSIYFDNVDDAMLTPTLLNRPYAVILVAQQEVSAYTQRIINSPTRNSLIAITRIQETVAAAGDISSVPIGLVNTPYVVSLVNDTTSSQVYSNTVNKTTTFNNDDFGLMNFGASGVYNEPAQAFVSEVIAYTGSIQISSSRTFIENNINNYYSIYTSSNAGYVARWYDQSGNNRHASQTTASSQPLIVLSGSLLSLNSRPRLNFSASVLNFTPYSSTTINTFGVIKPITISTGYTGYYQNVGAANGFKIVSRTYPSFRSQFIPYAGSSEQMTNSRVDPGSRGSIQYLETWIYNNSPAQLFQNSTDIVEETDVASGWLQGTAGIGAMAYQNGAPSGEFDIQEIVTYTNNISNTRLSVEYGINNYYNIYPQTSSFTTSSFTIKATPTGITGAINNQPLNGISSTGPVGFITVSRTGSNALTIARNGVTSSFTVPASGALSTEIYLGASNYNGITVGSSPLGISFASVGVGLTNSDLDNYYSLVDKLQFNLGRQRLLDMFPGAKAAYSLRKLSSTYTGSAIDVQSGTVSQSIGFDASGNLDTTTLLAFAGSGNAFVKTWYDQSGNNINFTQTNSSLQPQIVSSGSILTQTGVGTPKPVIRFAGGSRYLDCTETTVSTGDSSLFLAMQKGLGETNILATANGVSYYYLSYNASQYYGTQATSDPGTAFNVTSYGLISVTFKLGDELKFYRNNSLRITRTSPPIGAQTFNRLCGNAFGFYGAVNLNEIVIYPTNQITNRIGINSNINNYYQIY